MLARDARIVDCDVSVGSAAEDCSTSTKNVALTVDVENTGPGDRSGDALRRHGQQADRESVAALERNLDRPRKLVALTMSVLSDTTVRMRSAKMSGMDTQAVYASASFTDEERAKVK